MGQMGTNVDENGAHSVNESITYSVSGLTYTKYAPSEWEPVSKDRYKLVGATSHCHINREGSTGDGWDLDLPNNLQ